MKSRPIPSVGQSEGGDSGYGTVSHSSSLPSNLDFDHIVPDRPRPKTLGNHLSLKSWALGMRTCVLSVRQIVRTCSNTLSTARFMTAYKWLNYIFSVPFQNVKFIPVKIPTNYLLKAKSPTPQVVVTSYPPAGPSSSSSTGMEGIGRDPKGGVNSGSTQNRTLNCRQKYDEPSEIPDLHATHNIRAEWTIYGWDSTNDHHNIKAERIVLFFHGGAYIACSTSSHRALAWRLSKHCRARVLSVNYRLAPEHVFPCALQDAISAYFFLISPPPSSGAPAYDPSQIMFCGDSSGAGLSLSLCTWLRDMGHPLPACVALLSPWLDLTLSHPSFWLNEPYDIIPWPPLGQMITPTRSNMYVTHNSQLRNPYVSPYFLSMEQSEEKPFPPILIQLGDAERLCDEGICFYQKLKTASSPCLLEVYQDMTHVFQLYAAIDKVSTFAIQRVGEFALRHVGRRESNPAPPPPSSVSDTDAPSPCEAYWILADRSAHTIADPMSLVHQNRERCEALGITVEVIPT